jgi:hypothetical protein
MYIALLVQCAVAVAYTCVETALLQVAEELWCKLSASFRVWKVNDVPAVRCQQLPSAIIMMGIGSLALTSTSGVEIITRDAACAGRFPLLYGTDPVMGGQLANESHMITFSCDCGCVAHFRGQLRS